MKRSWNLWILLAILPLASGEALGCAVCYGENDSPMASGIVWGILSMIAVVYGVLMSIIGFFVFLRRRAALAEGDAVPDPLPSDPSR